MAERIQINLIAGLEARRLIDDLESVTQSGVVEHRVVLTVDDVNRFHVRGSARYVWLHSQPTVTEEEERSRSTGHDEESASSDWPIGFRRRAGHLTPIGL